MMTMQAFYDWMSGMPGEAGPERAWLIRLTRVTLSQIRAHVRLFGWEFWGAHS